LTCLNIKNNNIEEIGVDTMQRLVPLIENAKHSMKSREKIANLIYDLHKCAAKYLCENNSLILIPKLSYHSFKTPTGNMKFLRHCSFVDNLIQKSKQYSNCRVVVVDEHHTSMVCSNCGNMKEDLGANKEYNCVPCGYQDDRDHNSTKNILYKYIYENVPSNSPLVDVYTQGLTCDL